MILQRWLVTLRATRGRIASLRPENVHSLLSSWFDARDATEEQGTPGPAANRGVDHHGPQPYCLAGAISSEGDLLHLPIGFAGVDLSALLTERAPFGPVLRYSRKTASVVRDDTLEVVGLRLLRRETISDLWAAGRGATGWRVDFMSPAINRRYHTHYECLSGFEKLVGKAHRSVTDPGFRASGDPELVRILSELTTVRLADQVLLTHQELRTKVTAKVKWADEASTTAIPGTIGRAEWQLHPGKDPRPLHTVLMLGEYTGVGTRTSYGFGAVKVTPLFGARIPSGVGRP